MTNDYQKQIQNLAKQVEDLDTVITNNIGYLKELWRYLKPEMDEDRKITGLGELKEITRYQKWQNDELESLKKEFRQDDHRLQQKLIELQRNHNDLADATYELASEYEEIFRRYGDIFKFLLGAFAGLGHDQIAAGLETLLSCVEKEDD